MAYVYFRGFRCQESLLHRIRIVKLVPPGVWGEWRADRQVPGLYWRLRVCQQEGHVSAGDRVHLLGEHRLPGPRLELTAEGDLSSTDLFISNAKQ